MASKRRNMFRKNKTQETKENVYPVKILLPRPSQTSTDDRLLGHDRTVPTVKTGAPSYPQGVPQRLPYSGAPPHSFPIGRNVLCLAQNGGPPAGRQSPPGSVETFPSPGHRGENKMIPGIPDTCQKHLRIPDCAPSGSTGCDKTRPGFNRGSSLHQK
ncbi:hypothetical protein AAG570_003982 [Ranatra chinensis]|uniref:Uncharacterized protein n=1 Tax=Ranatra chinensis TaxID=642074 RepID=A0ABD0Y2H7_9HEMI